jgi:hypothetical protein
MPNTMSREDAICACDNILDLVECMDDKLPDQYAASVADRYRDMRKFIKEKWRSEYITEKMDNAIRNTWEGLRKWDRKEEFNDDLFYGLGEVREEVADADEAGETKAGTAKAADDRAKQEGKAAHARLQAETEAALAGLTPEQRAILERMTPQQHAEAEKAKKTFEGLESKPGPTSEEAKKPRPSPGVVNELMQKTHGDGMADAVRLLRTELSRSRENLNSTALDVFGQKGISVVTKDDIKHGDVLRVSKKTSSVRTQQLIEAAYTAGRIAGHYALSEEMKAALKRVEEWDPTK